MSGVDVHEATPEERSAAGAVTEAAYAEFASGFEPGEWAAYAQTLPDTRLRVEQGLLLVAVERGTVVATVTLYLEPQPTSGHWRPDDAIIRFLAVSADHRRRGIGKLMVAECADRARKAGKRRLALQTTPNMRAAQQMYLQLGFERDESGDMVAGSFTLLAYARRL